MQKKLRNLSSNGAVPRRPTADVISAVNRFILPLLVVIGGLFVAGDLEAVIGPPTHRLSVSFDLENHRIIGASRIELPANTGTKIHFGNLTVTRLIINGEEGPISGPQPEPLTVSPAGGMQQLSITYEKQFLPEAAATDGIIRDDGISLIGFWHPVLDQAALYELSVEIPANFEVVSEAEEIISTVSPAGKRASLRFPFPLQTIHLVAGPYVIDRAVFSGDKELFTYFFPEDQELGQRYLEKTLEYLGRFEQLLGEYPYRRFAVVENRLPTGIAFPTFTLLGQFVVRQPFILDTSLGHEVLHAWFGNGVRIDQKQGNWAEGLTTYLVEHLFARDKHRDITFRKEQLIKYQSYFPDGIAMPLLEFSHPADQPDSARQGARAVGYSKASMVFHMLKNALGEDLFFKALQDFYAEMNGKTASWSDLIARFAKVAPTNLDDFFHQWLEHAEIPHLTVRNLQSREKDGQPMVSFHLVQNNDPPFQLAVPVSINSSREKIKKIIDVTEQETEVDIRMTTSPEEMVIDADYNLMRQLGPEELPPVWSRFVGSKNKIAVVNLEKDSDLFKPLIDLLEAMECRIIDSNDMKTDLVDGSVIFLGTSSDIVRSLFARVQHPATGLTVDIRQNPFNPEHVVVLTSAQNRDEVAKVSFKLARYGKYSYLHFENGRVQEKRTRQTDRGLRYTLDTPFKGIEIENTMAFDDIVRKLLGKRVVYVGESHTSYEDHRLQLQIIRALYNQDPKLAIGMEMFSRPVQKVLDDYLDNLIDERAFLKQSHYFQQWGYDFRLYREIINFAHRYHIPIVALNLEKEIVSKVFKQGGPGALSAEEKKIIPLDRDLDMPGYRGRIASSFNLHSPYIKGHGSERFKDFFQAQALWDETMAESIAAYLTAHPRVRMVVLAGQQHMVKDTGIPPRVARRLPHKQAVVLNARGDEINAAQADFLIFSPHAALPPAPMLGVMLTEGQGEVTIVDLSPKGKARKAGIQKNDVLLAVDGEPVTSIEDVKIAMLYKKHGEAVKIRIKRPHKVFPDEVIDIELTL